MVDAGYMADQVADVFGGPSFTTLMTLLVLILLLWVAAAGALQRHDPLPFPAPPPADVRHAYDSLIADTGQGTSSTDFACLCSVRFLESAEPEGADDPHRRSQQRRQDGALHAGASAAALTAFCFVLTPRSTTGVAQPAERTTAISIFVVAQQSVHV